MKYIFIYILLLIYSTALFGQKEFQSETSTPKVHSNEEWGVLKYLWSQTRSLFSKDNKPIIGFDAIDSFTVISDVNEHAISADGKYFAYTTKKNAIGNWKRDKVILQSTYDTWRLEFLNGIPGFFSADSKQYILMNNGTLAFIKLGESQIYNTNQLSSYKKSANLEWVAYKLKSDANTVVLLNLITGEEKQYNRVSSYYFDKSGEWFSCQLANEEKELVIYNLVTCKSQHFKYVQEYLFDDSGKGLIIKTDRSLSHFDLENGRISNIWSVETANETSSMVKGYSMDDKGQQVVYVIHNGKNSSLWYWKKGMDRAVQKTDDFGTELEGKLIVGSVSFTDNRNYVILALKKKPDTRIFKPSAIKIDVWSYKDSVIQSTQPYLLQNPRTYKAVLSLETGVITYVEKDYERILVKGDFAVIERNGTSDNKINGDRFWEKDYEKASFWLVNLRNGIRDSVFKSWWAGAIWTFSPNGRYFVYCDVEKGCHYFSYDTHSGKRINITNNVLSGQFGNEEYFVRPRTKPTRGVGIEGWLPDGSLLVNDNYDVWQLDPGGKKTALNITNGYGRLNNTVLRLEGKPDLTLSCFGKNTLLLKAFNRLNKFNGFYKTTLGIARNPELLNMGPWLITGNIADAAGTEPLKASDTTVWIVKKQTYSEAPNYFMTSDFKGYRALTSLQPQKQYNWLKAELHTFKQLNGTVSQGILYKPENFDPAKKYPVIISFYFQATHLLYSYPKPDYLDSPLITDRPAWFVSQGYLVFVPDIFFTKGKWGPSVVNTVDGAAKYLSRLPFVDGQHMAACGHSNSGRFGYYLLTHSHSFAAISAGSGTTNVMSSALSLEPIFGANKESSKLVWAETTAPGSGLGNLWENKESWLDQTSVLHADNVTSPFLQFHNKRDGVPVEQAVQMYIALRRLEKKTWWLQYDDGGHTVWGRSSKDFTIRTTQFYDHYLKGAPAPKWMTQGVSTAMKGIDTGYDLDPAGSCSLSGKSQCDICEKWNEQYLKSPDMFSKPIYEWQLNASPVQKQRIASKVTKAP